MVAALGATFLGVVDALMVITALPTAAQEIGGVGRIALDRRATSVTVAIIFPIAGTVIDRSGAGVAFGSPVCCSRSPMWSAAWRRRWRW